MSDPENPDISKRSTPQWSLYQRENFWKTNEGEVPPFNTGWDPLLRRNELREGELMRSYRAWEIGGIGEAEADGRWMVWLRYSVALHSCSSWLMSGTTLPLMLANPTPISQIVRFSQLPQRCNIDTHQAKPSSVTESYPDNSSTLISVTPPPASSATKVTSPHTTSIHLTNSPSQSPPLSASPPSA